MMPYKTVAYYTLGCKLNFSETSTIARLFEDAGVGKVDFNSSADVYIVNTCSVTDQADKKCRNIVRRAKKNNPDAFVVVVGCYAQLKPKEIAAIPGVNLVLGANEKFNILAHLEQEETKKEENDLPEKGKFIAGDIRQVKHFVPSYSAGDRTRTFMKIQDGCDYFCSFCTIPLARGKSRSTSIAETIKVAEEIAATGVKEVVLTGVNTGDFGSGTDENFYQLIQQLDKVEGIERFRISSIEPNLLSHEIIEFCASSDKFVPHFHIPLQSGSNDILKLMRRKYERELYADRIAKIKALSPHCCIGVDVIVGFPGETNEHFLETYEFLKELDISYLHVFTYSERKNTTAIKMQGAVPMEVRFERNKMLQILSEKKKRAFYQGQLGTTHDVLFEAERDGDWMYGFTDNYVKVKVPYQEELVNTVAPFELQKIDGEGFVEGLIVQTTV